MKRIIGCVLLCYALSAFAQMQVKNSSQSILVTVTQGGNMGISTTNPSALLHASGSRYYTGTWNIPGYNTCLFETHNEGLGAANERALVAIVPFRPFGATPWIFRKAILGVVRDEDADKFIVSGHLAVDTNDPAGRTMTGIASYVIPYATYPLDPSIITFGAAIHNEQWATANPSKDKAFNMWVRGLAPSIFDGSIGIGTGLTVPLAPLHIKSISNSVWAYPNTANGKSSVLITTPGSHTTGTIPIEAGIMSYVPTLDAATNGYRIAVFGSLTESTNNHTVAYTSGALGFESKPNHYVAAVHGQVFNQNYSSSPSFTAAGQFTNARTTASDYAVHAIGNKNYFEGIVGIGTTDPADKLDVVGNVRALAFIATTSGAGAYKYNTSLNMTVPDYVFDHHFDKKSNNAEYKMLSLDELEKFLQTNRHLPRVPSRSDINNDGVINLQGISMISLEKTEENTLYIIGLQKQINELKIMNEKILKELALQRQK